MKKSLLFIVVLLFFGFMGVAVVAQDEKRIDSIEMLFPTEVAFTDQGKEYHLKKTGTSTRKKFFVTVYHVAHYMEQNNRTTAGMDKFQEVMQDDKVKQLTLKWVRDLISDKVQEGYRQSFKNALEIHKSPIQNEINQYIQLFNHDVKKDDEHILRWLPEGKIVVIINGGEPKIIQNKEFAQVLWSIWFGNKSVVNRDQLVSLL